MLDFFSYDDYELIMSLVINEIELLEKKRDNLLCQKYEDYYVRYTLLSFRIKKCENLFDKIQEIMEV